MSGFSVCSSFSLFSSWQPVFRFLPVWLSDVVGLSKTDTGIVFSCLSLFAISFQPLLGVISDRTGLKKKKPDLEYQPVTGIFSPPFFYMYLRPAALQYLGRRTDWRCFYWFCVFCRCRSY
ncbi:MFS transporter [Escherichia coli]|uniref:MFS transporter n=1 Tax=Escherichia coli TaxID=562 RepID=UPI004068EBCE